MNHPKSKVAFACSLFLLATPFAGLAADVVLLPTVAADLDIEPAIAVNPYDPLDAVAVWFTYPGDPDTRRGWYATTRDGWETTAYVDEFVQFSYPFDFSVVYDTFTGVFWACYNAGPGDVIYARSDTDGLGNLVFPTQNQVVIQAGSLDKAWLAVGGRPGDITASNLYAAYTVVPPDDPDRPITLKRSIADCDPSQQDANGRCWEPAQDLGVAGKAAIPLVSPTRPEIIYVAYRTVYTGPPPPQPNRIEIIKSANTGAGFGTPLVAATLEQVTPSQDPYGGGLAPCVAGHPKNIARFPSIAATRQTWLKEHVFLVWTDVNFQSPGCATEECGASPPGDVDI